MRLRAVLRMAGPTLVVVIAWFGIVTAANGAIDESERATEATARAVASRQRIDSDLIAFAEVEEQALAAIEQVEAVIPPEVNVPQLIALLAATDVQGDLAIEVISPNPTPQPLSRAAGIVAVDLAADGSASTLSRVEISVTGSGTYEATLAYLDRLSQSQRLFRIRSVELSSDGGADRVEFAVELDAFTTMAAGSSTAATDLQPTTTVPAPVIAFEEE
ncbi:MAG: hypothetical protein GY773_12570 [Actinomycetia bacterium]|nr:hypothetical protein [Actinomycetes bacterium]